jgi:predicted MPP superfamily phosphohydrolase
MIVMFSDLHLDNFRQFSTIDELGFNSRLLEQMRVVQRVVKYLHSLKAAGKKITIVFLGDLINGQGESIHKTVNYVMHTVARQVADIAPTYMVVGNHDVYRNIHILQALEPISNLQYVDKTTAVNIDGYDIDIVPWNCEIPEKRGDILMGHIPISGDEFVSVFDKNAIDRNMLHGYNMVFLGHYHTHHEFAVPGVQKAMYVGAIMANSFSDTLEDRGLTILDDGRISFVPIPSPKFIERYVSTQEQMDSAIKEYNETDNYFRIIVTSPDVTIPEVGHRVQFEVNYKSVETVTRLAMPTTKETMRDLVHRVIDLSNTALDRDEIKAELDSVMKGVWNV